MIDYLMSVNPIILASLGGLFTFLVTSLGSMLVFFTKNVSKNFIDASLSFSAGIMVSASYFSLISPAISILENNNVSLIVSLGEFIFLHKF